MKKIMFILAAAGTMAVAAPAVAQVGIYAGPGGVEVGVAGPRHYNNGYRSHRSYGYARRDCRTERVEIQRPNGRVVIKTRRICD